MIVDSDAITQHLNKSGVASEYPVIVISNTPVDGIRVSYGMQNECYIRQMHLEQGKQPIPTSARDPWRGTPCEAKDESGEWKPARFIALDLVGGEPLIQFDKRMPWFSTWNSVRGIDKDALMKYYFPS